MKTKTLTAVSLALLISLFMDPASGGESRPFKPEMRILREGQAEGAEPRGLTKATNASFHNEKAFREFWLEWMGSYAGICAVSEDPKERIAQLTKIMPPVDFTKEAVLFIVSRPDEGPGRRIEVASVERAADGTYVVRCRDKAGPHAGARFPLYRWYQFVAVTRLDEGKVRFQTEVIERKPLPNGTAPPTAPQAQ